MSTSVASRPDPVPDKPGTTPVTPAQAFLMVALTALVFVFTGWLITRGYSPHIALLTASGGLAVASGLTYVPRGLKRLAQAWGQS